VQLSHGTPTVTLANVTVSGNTASCSYSPGAGDLTDVAANLGPLADNGASTRTLALLSGSPAIEAGNPVALGSSAGACAPTDQRGVPRPQGPRCDIGAYERATCKGTLVNLVGTAGADSLAGTTGPDGCLLLGGDDSATGGDADDAVCGGDGNDQIFGGNGK
jgi:hypothetical protein